MPAGIGFAPGRDVAVTEKIRSRYFVALLDVRQQREQRTYHRLGERLVAIIVEFNADRRRVEIAVAAPVGFARMPRARRLVYEVNNPAIAADQIVRTYLRLPA